MSGAARDRSGMAVTQAWSPAGYAEHAGFVPALGEGILGRLAPRAGERILDLGCGDGVLTARLVEHGALVIGVDASPDMVAAARARGIDARVMDAVALAFDGVFDAVFSNAVLHWVRDPGAVLSGVGRALVPGGRFVAECGGHTNVAAIAVAIRAVLARRGADVSWPWYYPTPDEYRFHLESHGFVVESVSLVPRPTPLPTGMANWLRTFAGSLLAAVPTGERASAEEEIVELLRPSLCDSAGRWTADYVRLQVVARRS